MPRGCNHSTFFQRLRGASISMPPDGAHSFAIEIAGWVEIGAPTILERSRDEIVAS